MSQMNTTGLITGVAAAATPMFARVKFSSGTWAIAGDSDVDDGIAERPAFNANEKIAIRINNAPGTRKMIAAGSFTVGATLYAAANGKVDDSGTIVIGKALEAASADGDIVEVLPTLPIVHPEA